MLVLVFSIRYLNMLMKNLLKVKIIVKVSVTHNFFFILGPVTMIATSHKIAINKLDGFINTFLL